MTGPRRDAPPRRLPIVYFALGHGALFTALLVPALAPASIDSFFFHARMFFVVHLVTLGWITHSILGASYLAAPMALRANLTAGKADNWACAGVAIGASGVVAHFWLEEYSGIAYSGGMLLVAFGYLAVRVWKALAQAGTDTSVKWLVGCAYFNLLATAVFGTMLSINKIVPFLPGNHLQDVYAHAHVGLIGWAAQMVMGVGLKMLPMYLPARPPGGRAGWILLVCMQGGLMLLAAAWMFAPELAKWAALLPAAGVATFLGLVARMLSNRLPAPPKMRRPDVGMLHALQALCYLAIATGTGLYIVFAERLELGPIMAYGVFVLLGFFGQLILGIEMRLLPMYAWLSSWTKNEYKALPTSPHEMPLRPLQAVCFALWTLGVPLFAYGLWYASHRLVSVSAWMLLAGTLAATISTFKVLFRS
jgi:hypothetical protein